MATGVKGLLVWCKNITQHYENAPVSNMTTSWRNGLAFCAIIHYYRPDLIDYYSLDEKNVAENNSLAFRIAEEQFDIPALLDVEDMVKMSVPDRLSIMTYLSQYYNYFKDKMPGESSRSSRKRPNEWSHSLPVEKRPTNVQKTYTEKQLNASYCFSCGKVVYLMEKVVVEGFIFHRVCFKCNVCGNLLKSTTYKLSEDKHFCCEKHSSEKVEKPKEVIEFTDNSKSAECLKEEEKQINISPFRRNEVFTRRGLRPQSTPVDIQCHPSYSIKSGENVLQPTIPSIPKAKSYLANILKKKEIEENSLEFNNPAYQHHLELSAYMNRLNQSEPNLVHVNEKATESVICHKNVETQISSVSPTLGVSLSKDNLNSFGENCEKITGIASSPKKPDNFLSAKENCEHIVDSQAIKLPDNLLFFKGDCEQITDMKNHKKKLVLKKKKKGARKESFLNQKSTENEFTSNAGSASCEETSEFYESSCHNYENITSFKENAIISNQDSESLVQDSQPSENDYEQINYFEIKSTSNELEDSNKNLENLKTTNVFLNESKIIETNNLINTENILNKDEKNNKLRGSKCSEKSNNPFESSDSEPDKDFLESSKLSSSNPFLGSVDNLYENDFANSSSDATLNPFLSDSENPNYSNPFLCGSSDEDEAVMAVNNDGFSKKPDKPTIIRSQLNSSKKRMAPTPPVRVLNDKPTVVPRPSVRNIKDVSYPTADPRLSPCNSTSVSEYSSSPNLSISNKTFVKAPSVKKRAPNPPLKNTEKSLMNENVEKVKTIIDNVLGSSVPSQNVQESDKNINQSKHTENNYEKNDHDQNVMKCSNEKDTCLENLTVNKNIDSSRQSRSSLRQSNRRKAPERPAKPPVTFEEDIAEHELILKKNLSKIEIIENELSHIEQHQGILEMEGVEMEKKLRECQTGEQEEAYLIEWFQLVNKKNNLLRKENELIYMLQDIQLLNQQREKEFQLRQLILKPESMRSKADQQLENQLLETILLLVSKRNAIVDRLEEDRLKETEEDTEINTMINGLSSPSKSVAPASVKSKTKEKKKKKKIKNLKKK
ncbi:MICAL-like protein 1 isoform X1 [Hydra vulgaris]|uniref:MICAL-like protein 1 isoform X1 n=1 Tax=Hydra vulgaris TaxID=6087 RepID=UPI001F5E557F|nr:MICAL-like protein 1 [Hydra vulgaris]